MRVEDSGDTPAAGNLFHPSVTAMENPGTPDAVYLECVTSVVIGCGITRCEIVLVEAPGISIGSGVDAVAPTILGVE